MADKSHLRTRKDYSSEVLERHVKTMRLTEPSHEENISRTRRGRGGKHVK